MSGVYPRLKIGEIQTKFCNIELEISWNQLSSLLYCDIPLLLPDCPVLEDVFARGECYYD